LVSTFGFLATVGSSFSCFSSESEALPLDSSLESESESESDFFCVVGFVSSSEEESELEVSSFLARVFFEGTTFATFASLSEESDSAFLGADFFPLLESDFLLAVLFSDLSLLRFFSGCSFLGAVLGVSSEEDSESDD